MPILQIIILIAIMILNLYSMWSRTYHTNSHSVPFLMGFGVLLLFALLLWLGIFLAQKFNINERATQIVQPVQLTTPQQITDDYLKKINELDTALADPKITRDIAEQKMNDFFFSVRVPDTFRDQHLATVIKFKSNPKLTIANWREFIINLRAAFLKSL